ncbi:MAG: tetratricopeptide repeat protein [Acidobacteriaceae bacterium]|nr:tetratricopeptide repeat protein [Acidobacteriaceae bacterium]
MRAGFWIGAALLCVLWTGPAAALASMNRERADAVRETLNRGQADEALQKLDAALTANPNDAEALNFRCRVFYAEERWDDAIGACERAVQITPGNSDYHLWLGRAYGGKAQQLNLMAAYKMAKLIRAEFEAAATLDPKNGPALSDLGQFYAQAPAIVGGGYGKAEAVVRQVEPFSPVRALELRAQIAEQKKDYDAAEKALRAKISASHSSAQSWMDLGSFYERRQRWAEMLAALQSGAIAADRDHGPALADGGAILMKSGREPRMAIEWMRAYLRSNALSEEAPAFVVHARVGTLLKQLGDTQAAQNEFDAARDLAKDYAGLPDSRKPGH